MTGDDDETPRPRRSMGLFDLPVWRDWVFWLTVAPALVMTVGALGTQLDPGDGPPEPFREAELGAALTRAQRWAALEAE